MDNHDTESSTEEDLSSNEEFSLMCRKCMSCPNNFLIFLSVEPLLKSFEVQTQLIHVYDMFRVQTLISGRFYKYFIEM